MRQVPVGHHAAGRSAVPPHAGAAACNDSNPELRKLPRLQTTCRKYLNLEHRPWRQATNGRVCHKLSTVTPLGPKSKLAPGCHQSWPIHLGSRTCNKSIGKTGRPQGQEALANVLIWAAQSVLQTLLTATDMPTNPSCSQWPSPVNFLRSQHEQRSRGTRH